MTDKTFCTIYSDALEARDRDAFASEWSLSSCFPEVSDALKNFEICVRGILRI